jgi:Ni/Fe-hydrogenase subunit HybB-like protein
VLDSAATVRAAAVPAGVLGAGVAGYTAWLFGQCEGRDLWQTPLLLPLLLAQAVTAGGAALVLGAGAFGVPDELRDLALWCLFGGALAQLALTMVEITSHGTVHVEMATRAMTHGAYRTRFWAGVAVGMLAPAALALASIGVDGLVPGAIGAIAALLGLYLTEDAFVRAGQSVPLS